MKNPGILGGIFDFNKDGKLDVFESAAEYQFINDMMSEDEERDEFEYDSDFSDDED